ncbi:mavicyanin-like, partial [Phalaenopsis equestris]|uniref:mavicyanin-like n=1 Tax=Phalaenopsis equestris TaxID=78828 RepID=UPI0009E4B52A
MTLIFSPTFAGSDSARKRGNTSTHSILIALLLAAAASLSSAVNVYNVGDNAGWTIGANYSTWASRKNFHVGDTILFIYNKSFHNVLEVTKTDYHSCNSASPIATHATGNDSIPINRYGHRFFICGFPGHCAAGQKLDVRIPKHSAATSPSSSASPSDSSPVPGGAGGPFSSGPGLAPHGNGGAQSAQSVTGFGVVAVIAVAISCFD